MESLSVEDPQPAAAARASGRSLRSSGASEGRKSRISVTGSTGFEIPRGGATKLQAVSNVVTALIGAGILAMPTKFVNSGYVGGSILLLFSGFVSYYTGDLIVKAAEEAEARTDDRLKNYEDVIVASCGRVVGKIASSFVISVLFGIASIYLVLLANQASLFRSAPQESDADAELWHTRKMITVMAAIQIPMACVRDVSSIAKAGAIGILAIFVLTVVVSGSAIFDASAENLPDLGSAKVAFGSVSEYASSFNVFLLSNACAMFVPSIRDDLEDPKIMPSVMWTSLQISTGIYAIVCLPCAFSYYERLQSGDVLKAMEHSSPYLSIVSKAMVMVNLLVSYPIIMNILLAQLASALAVLEIPGLVGNMARSSVVMAAWAIAFAFPNFGPLIDILASATFPVLILFFPVMAHFGMMVNATGSAGAAIRSMGNGRCVLHFVLLGIGMYLLMFGLHGSIDGAIKAFSPNDSTNAEAAGMMIE